MSFKCLPYELKMLILDDLDVVSKIRLRRVCRQWNGLLRQSDLYSTLLIAEDDMEIIPQSAEEQNIIRGLAKKLVEHNIHLFVEHLVIDGGYDYSTEDLDQPNERENPYKFSRAVSGLLDVIVWGRSWYRLDTVTIQNAFVNQLQLRIPRDCWLELHHVSVGIDCERPSIEVEYFVESFSGELSGDQPCMWTWFPMMSCTDGSSCKFKSDIPYEIGELFAPVARAIMPEDVIKLKDVYAELLKGREGCIIRDDAINLFSLLGALPNRDFYNEDTGEHDDPGREWTKKYFRDQFARLDAYWYYNLLYYSKPRNFYTLASAEELATGKDKDGYEFYTSYGIDVYKKMSSYWDDDSTSEDEDGPDSGDSVDDSDESNDEGGSEKDGDSGPSE